MNYDLVNYQSRYFIEDDIKKLPNVLLEMIEYLLETNVYPEQVLINSHDCEYPYWEGYIYHTGDRVAGGYKAPNDKLGEVAGELEALAERIRKSIK